MPIPDVSRVYNLLFDSFGPQNWWPGETKLEVIIGAVLTQNTSWKNVERAIANLKGEGLMELEKLAAVDQDTLAELIRPSGYFNVKVERLKEIIWFFESNGGIEEFQDWDATRLRSSLLDVKGVGEETADSILLYAFEKPVFVVDAYTRRVFSRLRVLDEKAGYQTIQNFFHGSLPTDTRLFNEYHALIVKLGKEICRKRRPICVVCPLQKLCPSQGKI